MRFGILFIAAASAAGCGSPEADSAAPPEESEVTLELPPELPPQAPVRPSPPPAPQATEEAAAKPAEPRDKEAGAEPKREEPAPAKAEEPPRREEAAPEAAAAEEAAGARPPLADAAIARTIDRIGYRCGNVLSATRLEETNAAGQPVYRIACSSGETYRGTNRGGRMYFRPWTGRLSGR